jgi:2-C-methyl-D-erythritol 4-phosphate cytidylyltransferase
VTANYFALIPAAGAGARFGATTPKQYLDAAGRPLLWHAARALLAEPRIARVFIVLSSGDERFATIPWDEDAERVAPLYCGGDTRAATVRNGLIAAGDVIDLEDWVLVHDAARPCLRKGDVTRLIDTITAGAQRGEPGGLLAVPVADTLKRATRDEAVERTIDRAGLWRALTPQMFRYALLTRALSGLDLAAVTDEASAVEQLGLQPRLVRGSSANLKVTLPEDLEIARALLAAGFSRAQT